MSNAYDRTLKAWADDKRASLDPRILDLIRGVEWDLHFGPLYGEDAKPEGIADWPGFSKACDEIRRALDDVRQVWLPVKAIADGADVSVRHARKVLAALAAKGDVRVSAGLPKLYAALGGSYENHESLAP